MNFRLLKWSFSDDNHLGIVHVTMTFYCVSKNFGFMHFINLDCSYLSLTLFIVLR